MKNDRSTPEFKFPPQEDPTEQPLRYPAWMAYTIGALVGFAVGALVFGPMICRASSLCARIS